MESGTTMTERVLSGRYVLEECIGSGGMAEVWRANDHLLARTVAVKILHAAYKNDVEFIERFHREAKAAAGLSHPNIVSIFDVGLEGDDHFIVMEYVPGSTLKEKIKNEAPLDIPIAVRIAKDIASGLANAHANNLVHCDIKPHNILMTDDNRAKIGDFGIARAVTESTMTYSGSVMGSVHYFSPEQARGSMITPKSDVYSLGIVMYEMLTGRLPFNGDNPVTIAMKHVEEEPVPPTAYRHKIPPMLEAIVLRAMNKNPDTRPTSAELVQELAVVEKTFGMTKAEDPDATKVLPRAEANIPSRRAARRKPTPPSEPPKKSFFQSKMFAVGLMVFLLMGFGLGSFLAFGNFFNQEEVIVPDVKGKQLALARQLLEDGKLRVNVAETYDGTVPPGQVVSQDPESGKTVRSARLVTIYVSKGGEELEMPDLKGLPKSAAMEVITKAGLNLDSIYEKYSDEEPGTVLSHDPVAGTKINRGSLIDITVSKGEGSSGSSYGGAEPVKAKKTSVPDLQGASLDLARTGLEAHGLTIGTISYQISTQAEGTVLRQTPSAGTELYSGEAVDLVVAEPEPEPTHNSMEEPSYYETDSRDGSDRSDSTENEEPVRSFVPGTEPELYGLDRETEEPSEAPSRENGGTKSR